MNNSGIKKDS